MSPSGVQLMGGGAVTVVEFPHISTKFPAGSEDSYVRVGLTGIERQARTTHFSA